MKNFDEINELISNKEFERAKHSLLRVIAEDGETPSSEEESDSDESPETEESEENADCDTEESDEDFTDEA